mmetsp:Transcript_27808/g.75397  ORF Transcript_27808/g.75397 Transcript_27808/m.75397 type:complete len:235 (-) Transcript_27808:201-905(-)
MRHNLLACSPLVHLCSQQLLLQVCGLAMASQYLRLRLLPAQLVLSALTLHLLPPHGPSAAYCGLLRGLRHGGEARWSPRARLSAALAAPHLGQLQLRLRQLLVHHLLGRQRLLEAREKVRLALQLCAADVGGVGAPGAGQTGGLRSLPLSAGAEQVFRRSGPTANWPEDLHAPEDLRLGRLRHRRRRRGQRELALRGQRGGREEARGDGAAAARRGLPAAGAEDNALRIARRHR